MKKLFLISLALLGFLPGFSQDTIRFRSNEARAVKVKEIGIEDVKYSRFENLDGPQYITNKSEIYYIRYQNGHIDVFNEVSKHTEQPAASKPDPKPIEQPVAIERPSEQLIKIKGHKLEYGGRGLGDSKLLRLINNYQYQNTRNSMLADYKLYKGYKRNQYISGFVGLGVGLIAPYIGLIASVLNTDPATGDTDFSPFVAGLAIGGTVGITGGVISSVYKHKRRAQRVKIARMYNEMK